MDRNFKTDLQGGKRQRNIVMKKGGVKDPLAKCRTEMPSDQIGFMASG